MEAEQAKNALKEPSAIGNAVVAKIRGEGISIYEETAILRKTLAFLLNHMNLTYEEFDEFNAKVEQFKAEARDEANRNTTSD